MTALVRRADVARHTHRMVRRAVRSGGGADASTEQLRALLAEREVDLDEVLTGVVRAAGVQLEAERATLYLVDHIRQELVSHVLMVSDVAEIRLALGEGVAGWVATNGQLLNVPTGRGDPRFVDRIDVKTGFRTRSLLAAPVLLQDRVVGVLQLLNKRSRARFDEHDESGLSAICTHVAALLGASSLRGQLRLGHRHALSWRFNHIVGQSPPMQAAYELTARVARTDVTVLITGETGTGKELFARAVHYNSARRDGPLVTVDCSALPTALVENELFGHERGAYTGADRDSIGKVAAAEGGTLFLDEIGELPRPAQARLLRLIQERTYCRVGGTQTQTADVRFVCATRRDLWAEVRAGRFREDLYYRLRVVELELPPLRRRGHGDLDRLIDHFLFELARAHGRPQTGLSSAARAALHAHAWPGNVRELKHCLEAAVVLCDDQEVARIDLRSADGATPASVEGQPVDSQRFVTDVRPLRDVDRDYVSHVVDVCGGNRSEAARRLEIGRNTLARKLRTD